MACSFLKCVHVWYGMVEFCVRVAGGRSVQVLFRIGTVSFSRSLVEYGSITEHVGGLCFLNPQKKNPWRSSRRILRKLPMLLKSSVFQAAKNRPWHCRAMAQKTVLLDFALYFFTYPQSFWQRGGQRGKLPGSPSCDAARYLIGPVLGSTCDPGAARQQRMPNRQQLNRLG